MAKVEEALARLKELPLIDQEAIAEIILSNIEQQEYEYELTEAQLTEMERLADEPEGELLTTDEVRKRLKLPRE